MGPTIILDKSALQSLSRKAIYELSTYFYTNVTPVVLMEILADLRLEGKDINHCRNVVSDMARKVIPPRDAITNMHYKSLCIADLLGKKIEMDHRPIVAGGQQIITADGRKGFFVGPQSENEAVLRWLYGEISEADLEFASNWRKTIKLANLEEEKRILPKLAVPIKSLPELRNFVDLMLDNPDMQIPLLERLMEVLKLQVYIREWVHGRWRNNGYTLIRVFAPYAYHYLRINLLFYFGVSSGLLGTRNSNIVDIEYLYYVPFCWVFSSGDKFLRQMASLVLADDQSFVERDDLKLALDEVATRRSTARNESPKLTSQLSSVEPYENSLIQVLWKKHLGGFAPQTSQRPISKEQSEQSIKELKPIIEAMEKAYRQQPPRMRFPI